MLPSLASLLPFLLSSYFTAATKVCEAELQVRQRGMPKPHTTCSSRSWPWRSRAKPVGLSLSVEQLPCRQRCDYLSTYS